VNQSEITYGRASQALHWSSAILIIIMILLGLIMTRISESGIQVIMYRTHVTIGLIVLVLTIIRLFWLFVHRWLPTPPGLSNLRRLAFKWNHILLYAFLILMLLSGLGMLILSGIGILPVNVTPEAIRDVPPRTMHIFVSKVFILLLLMHLAGVFQYQFKKGDVMSRMGIKWLAKYSPKSKID